ncbi:hypothetical protein [Clostridium beijerinckii]|uniref:Uncharacterized protein n=1 Tax=Clostridium beijerinckii TaxID=1520 RepID=A0AAX0AUA1_CLOBE|nr:hypothetical protein [Clostridium beijerinckii]MBA8934015.1 hypothetical protein [Clostridium beijerinckii]NOW05043.1 hypothetical protein [Clostridium beijerinckii]NRT36075.1 hypothetical protein [Clostridium beijerinckii]NRT44498.1 hypothetical protein [Clostridium beijerinckii]NRT72716.1 hypothetical protein [Clostridium beijerinckii]
MKKFIVTFSIFSFLLFSITTINSFAVTKTLTQGLYTLKDSGLVTGTDYNVENNSSGRAMLLIVDSTQLIQELIRFEPNSRKYTLKPLNYGDIIIIIGAGNLEFS